MSISDLVSGTPVDADYIGEGAGKIRAINDALVEAFGSVAGPIDNASGVGNNPPTHIDFSQLFTRLEAVETSAGDLQTNAVPAGVILLWSGAVGTIPSGWALCDGSQGTPDLRDRFVMGRSTTNDVGTTGGSTTTDSGGGGSVTLNLNDHSIVEANLPKHSHKLFASGEALQPDAGANAVGANDVGAVQATVYNSNAEYAISKQTGGANNPANVGKSSEYGQDTPAGLAHSGTATAPAHTHDVTPPFMALAYIMKLAV